MTNIFKTVDLFAGIGGIRLAFEQCNCINVFSSEWDEAARLIYKANFNETPHGDINLINPLSIPDHDILLAGFPCQPFSIAGKGLGFLDTRGTLFFNIESILKYKQPSAFLLENVKRLTTHDEGRTYATIVNHLKHMGYTIYAKVLNSLDFGVPQKRERIYIIGFREPIHYDFPKGKKCIAKLSDILENDSDVPSNYYINNRLKEKRMLKVKGRPPVPSIWHENIGGNVSALPYSCALRAGGSYNYLLVNGVRRLTGREMLRLQGFPDSYVINVPYSQIRKLAGNSVTVPLVRAIAENMIFSLTNKTREYTHNEYLFA